MTTARDFFLLNTGGAAGAVVSATRPADVTPYAIGDVYGAAGDARFQLTVPALPSDTLLSHVAGVVLKLVQHRDPAGAPPSLLAYLASGPFETILGDNQPLSLNDADIRRVVLTMVTIGGAPGGSAVFLQGNGVPGALAHASGVAGRRHVRYGSGAIEGAMHAIVAGSVMGLYFALATAYVPIASEQIDVHPVFLTTARIT